jgi:hypothetical protein
VNELDSIRKDILTRRLGGGSNRIRWTPEGAAQVRHHISEMPERELLRAAEAKFLHSQSTVESIEIPTTTRAMNSTALGWLFTISFETPDLCTDLIKVKGWDTKTSYGPRNRPVLFCHRGDMIPVGQSTQPYAAEPALMAACMFPEPGVSETSDQVRAASAAGLIRGASVGFVPGRFKFSTDSARPLGIDFISGHILTEWSICSVPCHPLCVVSGPISPTGDKSAEVDGRRREARALAAKARALGESIQSDPVLTREQRLAEARNFRHLAGRS